MQPLAEPVDNEVTSSGNSCCGEASSLTNGCIKIESWDSRSFESIIEATESLEECNNSNPTVDSRYNIPLDIQLRWYEWILYQIDECIDAYWATIDLKGLDEMYQRGFKGPLNNLITLENRATNDSPPSLTPLSRWQETISLALEFRHAIEHRYELMEIPHLEAALRIPHLLKATACDERLQEADNAITTKYAKAGSPTFAPPAASNCPLDEIVLKKVLKSIHEPPSFSYKLHLGLLYQFIDSLLHAAFDLAIGSYPEYFKERCHYKAYDPKYWARDYSYSLRGTESAFLVNDATKELLEDAFEGLVDIRNYFVHRYPPLTPGDIDRHSKDSRFWNMKRSAVKLALVLGEVKLALKFDVDIRMFHSGREEQEIIDELEADGVEAAVKGLMSGPGEQREVVLAGELFNGELAFKKLMRRRWVCLDLLIEGEYSIRRARSGPLVEEEDGSSSDWEECSNTSSEKRNSRGPSDYLTPGSSPFDPAEQPDFEEKYWHE